MRLVRLLAGALAMTLAPVAAAAVEPKRVVPEVSEGRIVDLGVLTSRHADPRRVVVWLPPHYSATGNPYAVLYMHDGQNLFDKATAGYGMEWQVDEVASRLMREGKMRPAIVVGVWNTPKRLREYLPSKAFDRLPPQYMDRVRGLYGGEPLSDGYLKFIVTELKPAIDRRFNVLRDRKNTLTMGSSMGALISLYAINQYPQVFGGAGMVSTHWPLFLAEPGKDLTDEEVNVVASSFEAYLRPSLTSPKTHRLYFDHGTETLDSQYAVYQQRIDRIVAAKGYRQGRNWVTRNFPGQEHNEKSWASRVEVPLQFLLPPFETRSR
jgi:enterochelin esterase-like enzyme